VSATVHISEDSAPKRQLSVPFFSCPRRYSDVSQEKESEFKYVHERFEESDLLPPLAIALAGDSLDKAFEVFLAAFSPRDTSLTSSSPGLESISASFIILMLDTFYTQQFTRGYGDPVNWLTDPTILRNVKLELDSKESVASSKVIGAFGSTIYPNILFQKDNTVGIYRSFSKEHSILSRNADFFGAGIEYSTYESATPITAEPSESITTPPSSRISDIRPEQLNSYLNLPSNISLFPLAEPPTVPQTPNHPPESPSFFSPSFSKDLAAASTNRDPRIHTINIPFRLDVPTRSQSYPTTPGPQRSGPLSSSYSSIGRSQTSHRSSRRPLDTTLTNITPITAKELEDLIATGSVLLIDIRAFSAYAKGRLADAINVCIPTVLLKRSSLSLTDISDSIVSRGDRGRFAGWKEAQGIVLYDADSLRVKDSHPLVTLAAKFVEAGFERTTYGLIGTTPSIQY
jgi:rhodanese-related sulfurtransferase